MWILLIVALALMSALTIIQTPREWMQRKILRILVTICHIIGITSIALILFVVYRMKDGPLRESIIWIETFYVNLALYALVMTVVRHLSFSLASHFKHQKILHILTSSTAFFTAVIIVTVAYMIPAIHSATNLKTDTYDIQVDKTCDEDRLSVAVVSDFHVGGGARHQEMDQMAELLNEAKPDVILIAGDVCDSASSVYDLSYMEKVLKNLKCRYGVFYAEGNHEIECRYDPEPYLTRAGVTILKDKGITLENGVNIIGRKNTLKESAAQIMKDCKLDLQNPTIVFQHRPVGLHRLDGVADLAVCGHTHGYSFPFLGVMMPYLQDISYGHRLYGNTHVIVSAGISEWGFRTKWPSQSDVSVIHMNFRRTK